MSSILSNGLVIGGIYGLVALGISLIYKKSRALNFAYGETGMVGAFVFYSLHVQRHIPYLVGAIVGVAVSTVIGALTYLVLMKRRNDPLNMLIGTLAIGGVLIFAASDIWDPNQHFVPPPFGAARVHLLGLVFPGARLLVVVVGALLAAGLFAFFRLSNTGLKFRASATDPYAASLVGIDVVRLDVATWAVAGALSGVAAILVAPLVGFDPFFMTLLSIRGFAAALVAGLGNVGASLLAGVGIGIAESALTRATTQPGMPEAMLVTLIVGVLLIRSQQKARATA